MTSTSNFRTPAWTRIEELVKDVHGWTPLDQLFALHNLTIASSDVEGDIVEVGSWCGRSAVVLAAASRVSGKSKVRCVDLFPAKTDWRQNADETYSFEMTINGKKYGGYQEQTVWKEAFESQTGKIYEKYESVYDCFRETVEQRGMTDVIEAHQGDLASMLEKAGASFKCRLAFLDGDHGFEAVCADIRNIDRHLSAGGWLCFDDAFTSYEGVNKAIEQLVIANPAYECCQQLTRKLFVARKKVQAA